MPYRERRSGRKGEEERRHSEEGGAGKGLGTVPPSQGGGGARPGEEGQQEEADRDEEGGGRVEDSGLLVLERLAGVCAVAHGRVSSRATGNRMPSLRRVLSL